MDKTDLIEQRQYAEAVLGGLTGPTTRGSVDGEHGFGGSLNVGRRGADSTPGGALGRPAIFGPSSTREREKTYLGSGGSG